MKRKVVVTGAAGLVGQNLITLLKDRDDLELVAIDLHEHNLKILGSLHPEVTTVVADLSVDGDWGRYFRDADIVVQLHAHIAGKSGEAFDRNTIKATENVLGQCHSWEVPFIVHVSSLAVRSLADDHYANSKKSQERLVRESGLEHCVLRPSLMFGWFDPKHLGWLSRFMAKVPIFPIPGDGKFPRQPLYVRDFCRVISWCMEHKPSGAVYEVVGPGRVYYVDLIREIKKVRGFKTLILNIPYRFFIFLLKLYALLPGQPPFTADQLESLRNGDMFTGVDMKNEFGIEPTPFDVAIRETLLDPQYGHVVVKGAAEG